MVSNKVPLEDLHNASELLVRALLIRKKYMNMSSQRFPSAVERFLHQLLSETTSTNNDQPPPPHQTAAAAGQCLSTDSLLSLPIIHILQSSEVERQFDVISFSRLRHFQHIF